MTTTDPAGAAPARTLRHDLIATLEDSGFRLTEPRRQVADSIESQSEAFTAEDLCETVPDVGRATVYRTIKLLQEAGIITQALFDAKQAHYQLVYGKAPRDYMVCMKTSRYIEFSDDELVALRDRICKRHGWDPVGHRFQIYAISPEGKRCRA